MENAAVALRARAVEYRFALLFEFRQCGIGIRKRRGTGLNGIGEHFDAW